MERTERWDQFARRVRLDLMQAKVAHAREQIGRRNFQRIAGEFVSTVFNGVAAIRLARLV